MEQILDLGTRLIHVLNVNISGHCRTLAVTVGLNVMVCVRKPQQWINYTTTFITLVRWPRRFTRCGYGGYRRVPRVGRGRYRWVPIIMARDSSMRQSLYHLSNVTCV